MTQRGAPPARLELPYTADSGRWLERIARRPWAVFLDSGWPSCPGGRFDILSAEPLLTLTTRGPTTEIREGPKRRETRADPFQALQQALGPPRAGIEGLPFSGGAIGYFGYDLARRLERLPATAADDTGLPEMAVGVYSWALVVDHLAARSWLVGRDPDELKRRREVLLTDPQPRPECRFRVLGPPRPHLTRRRYAEAFARIQGYIHAGDCYQVNLAQRFSALAEGDPWWAYRRLRRLNPAPYSAYLATPGACVLSCSPERFLRVRDGRVQTRPIKGTRPRDPDPGEDRRRAAALAASPKDRAENVMIVDLLRNDLGKVCEVGSIHVPELFAVESFARVHHLVSTVAGRLDTGRTALDLLRACFPGGSITGAPKLRAMEIIEELEGVRRGVYCGAIGYLGDDGAMDTNIAIRTLIYSPGKTHFWAGGGIVRDSDPEQEYRESLDKAGVFLDFLRSLRR
jgi:para-aminobenzoate synthetase component 1